MFDSLSKRLSQVLDKIRGTGVLTEASVTAALREVRVALLEADVALPVVKQFIEEIRTQAIGQEVIKSVTAGQMVVKIVHDHLVTLLGGAEPEPLNLSVAPPAVILMVGLQGSGKTTSSGKLARFLSTKQNKKVLMASLDIYRPAAQQQLETLGQQLKVDTLPIIAGEAPLTITDRALDMAQRQGYDVLILDSAGRLHIDDVLMAEVAAVKQRATPIETFLVADAMTGQDAVIMAREFHEKVGVTGIILTRVDGDARGGAALSMRAVTGRPIKFMGIGEKLDQFELFQPERIAGRILDMGDVVSLVEKAAEVVNEAEAEKMAVRMAKGQFDLTDMITHLQQMLKMGGISSIMGMLPGMGKFQDQMAGAGINDKMIKRQIAIVQAMTMKERRNPALLNASRKRRIAAGAGQTPTDVNRLLKQFDQMQLMMKRFSKMGKGGMLRQGLGSLFGGGNPFGRQ